jgi:hypothetical protein
MHAGPVPGIYFQDHPVSIPELRQKLDAVPGKNRSLIVRADRGVPYELVMSVGTQAMELGYRVILATATPTASIPPGAPNPASSPTPASSSKPGATSVQP